MKLVVLVVGVRWYVSPNPFVLEIDPYDVKTREELETYGQRWAQDFPDDIVMLVEEVPE